MKNIRSTVIIAILGLILGVSQVQAFAFVSNASSEAAQDIISNPGRDSDQDSPAGVTSNPTNDSDQDGFTPVVVVTPETPAITGGGSPGSSSGGQTSSGTGYYFGNTVISAGVNATGTLVYSNSCPLITTYMKMGGDNSAVEVSKLQAFLKNTLDIDVDVNGKFDQKTEDAVKAFQTAYMSDILGPWNATQPSGFVYITTSKKINELACKTPLTLNADELATINSYIRGNSNDDMSSTTIGASDSDNSNAGNTDSIADEDNTNVANVSSPSILQKFWNFILSLFRRI